MCDKKSDAIQLNINGEQCNRLVEAMKILHTQAVNDHESGVGSKEEVLECEFLLRVCGGKPD